MNSHVDMLLDRKVLGAHVSKYIEIRRGYEDESQADDFQKKYRKFFSMNQARLPEPFLERYFEILARCHATRTVDLFGTLQDLHKIPINKRGDTRLHFSFVTKLVHTAVPTTPIYDSRVAFFYFMKPVDGSAAQRIHEYKVRYQFLQEEYARILEYDLLSNLIAEFRSRFDEEKQISSAKVIDALIWRFTSLLRDGALENRRVIFR
ncbi:hypothetical protein [Thermomonas aquatica]|uniref:Uncharacterized protein n=1 Tax=Thermomonas aquatica TaxID=2202149 RepID=A0A5B7ZPP7_9GAMM|nr:hypothetical protein [Thermomonas aquatica]QDA57030.1 hypothetical protein FHQ07_06715 [Thermomonas aquatica]